MIVHLNHDRAVKMTKYADLCAEYARSEDRRLEFLQKMYGHITQFTGGFRSFIDVPEKTQPGSGEEPHPYVRALLASEDAPLEFPPQLEGDNGNLVAWFRISLLLERGPNISPKSNYITKIGLHVAGGAIVVLLPEIVSEIVCPMHDGKAQFDEAYLAIISAIERQLRFDLFHGERGGV